MLSSTASHTKVVMGMPITVKIVGGHVPQRVFQRVFDWFAAVDGRYSPFKPDSEVSRINAGLPEAAWSDEMRDILARCERTKAETNGYFDAYHDGQLDPSGLVKGWAIREAARLVERSGYHDFYIDAGGDIEAHGLNADGQPWRVGIRNPFNRREIIKVIALSDAGVATSGTYIRGEHIYNPHGDPLTEVASLTVIGPNVYEADRFATAAYAMGTKGAAFIAGLQGFAAYIVTPTGRAIFTPSFEKFLQPPSRMSCKEGLSIGVSRTQKYGERGTEILTPQIAAREAAGNV